MYHFDFMVFDRIYLYLDANPQSYKSSLVFFPISIIVHYIL